MNKRRLHHFWTKFRGIRPYYFLALFLASGVVCIFALRANNEHMVKLRDAVFAADKAGTDVQTPLRALQSYVTSHMNTELATGPSSVYPPIQLKYTYDRLVQAEGNQIAATNSQLYSQAQAYCEAQNHVDFSGHNRVPCIEQYVESHSTIKFAQIPAALYEFSFVSPRWSPDLAGWSLLATILFGLAFLLALVTRRWFKRNVV